MKKARVTYLIGAGATHACAKAVSSPHGVLMSDLSDELAKQVHELIKRKYRKAPEFLDLVNEAMGNDCDFEHVITFLDESVSGRHRQFADELRVIFERVLRKRLKAIERDHGEKPVGLYATLIDLHEVRGAQERLHGLLTLNYDDYIEAAVKKVHKRPLDLGLSLGRLPLDRDPVRLMKLHGSFDWRHTWPVSVRGRAMPLWIPPGIQKAKGRYPFNLIWGRAREVLDCDILRVIGCRLSPNDWDLVSMLFATRLVRSSGRPYSIEVIDSPVLAEKLQSAFPYLSVKSLLEIDRIGAQLIGEFTSGPPRELTSLSPGDKIDLLTRISTSSHNWFLLWLKHKAETLLSDYGNIKTRAMLVDKLLAAYP